MREERWRPEISPFADQEESYALFIRFNRESFR